MAVAYPTYILDSIGGQAERGWEGNVAPCLKASHYKFPPVITQAAGFCPEQSEKTRGIGWEDEMAPTLRAGVTPAVMCKTYDARGNGDGETVSTLTGDHENRITDYTSVVCEPKVYTKQAIGAYKDCGKASTLKARDYKDTTDLVCGVDCRNLTETPELYQTLQAKPNGGQSLNYSGAVRVRYVVRRLTPTECARLQGFPDRWGHPDQKDDFTDEEYSFWLNVRNTHAAINGKAVKEYTKAQMLAWYGKLHTDSAEYKMWGNGIALPPALYCMQGIADASRERS